MSTPLAGPQRVEQQRQPSLRRVAPAGAACLVVLVILTVLVAQPAQLITSLDGPVRLVTFVGGSWLAYAVGAVLVRRLPVRWGVVLIVVGGISLPLAAGFAGGDQRGIFGPPRSSDDLYRYVWDGRVQAAGVDPYRYVPAAPELFELRDDFLWPDTSHWCVGPDAVDPDAGRPLVPGCSLINRPTVHTIYPPVAEALFLAIHGLSPPLRGTAPVQLVMAAFAAATTVLLVVGLRSARLDPRLAVLWAWCPVVAVEAGNNAHVDVVAAFLTGLALLVLARARTRGVCALGGVLVGLAIATKLTPALVAPALVRRRPLVVAMAAAGAVAIVYLPHVMAVGTAVIGYIPGYLTEEGYTDGSRFALLTILMPHAWAGPGAIAVLVAVTLWVARTTDPDRPWLAATTMAGAALLVATPSYSWYAMLLVLLVALGGRPEWLVVALAAQLAQDANNLHLTPTMAQRLGYGTALAVVLLGALIRQRARPTAPTPAT
jgi:MFS family permease